MTDKELISIVAAKAKKLWNEINTGHEYSIIDSYNQFYGICMEIAEMVQEEPISKEMNEAAWQYYDRNKPLMPPELDLHKELIDFFKAGARWKKQNDSNLSEVLDRDNLDEMAEGYSSCTYLEEVLGEGDREVLKARLNNTFKAGAKWQKEKMLENAVDGIITFDYYSDDDKEYGCIAHDSFCLEDMDLKDRDKVKIAVIK